MFNNLFTKVVRLCDNVEKNVAQLDTPHMTT